MFHLVSTFISLTNLFVQKSSHKHLWLLEAKILMWVRWMRRSLASTILRQEPSEFEIAHCSIDQRLAMPCMAIHGSQWQSMAIHGYEICLDMRSLAPLRPLRLRPQLPGLLGGMQAGVRGGWQVRLRQNLKQRKGSVFHEIVSEWGRLMWVLVLYKGMLLNWQANTEVCHGHRLVGF